MKQIHIPDKGRAGDALLTELESMKANDMNWRTGHTFSLIYNAGEDIIELGRRAYSMFLVENGLSPISFPSLKRLETEVVSMVGGLLGGGAEAAGNMTTGGTESIFMAVKSARDYARKHHPHITAPELVKPVTAHPAFDKSAHYLDMKVVTVPVGDDLRAVPAAMAAATTDNTIFMVGSAFTYPHGMVDPIPEMAAAAAERGVWFHTDSCLGGFVLPFARRLGYDIPDFDLSVPGVLSISCDLHKYAFCPKGASTVIYKNATYRQFQYFVHTDFPGGVYGTPTLCGGRTGGPLAGAWTVINHLGVDGYTALVKKTMETCRAMQAGVNAIGGLRVLGAPHGSVFAMGGALNVYALADVMAEKGWFMEKQHLPASLHVTVSPFHENIVDKFLDDLTAAADAVRGIDASKISQEAAMYGMMATMPDRKLAHDLALSFLTDLYKVT